VNKGWSEAQSTELSRTSAIVAELMCIVHGHIVKEEGGENIQSRKDLSASL